MKGTTIEVDITHRCNLACRHCNRLCNADKLYGIHRTILDMDMRHIVFLISEIKKLPKESIGLVRILGGEPLLSNIIEDATESLIALMQEGYIQNINIVTNGTIKVPKICKPYIVYSPQIVGDMIKNRGTVSSREIYAIKDFKHRNITITPLDYDLDYMICNRVEECGIHYSVYGFAYTAPCFPSLMVSRLNHKYFRHSMPHRIENLVSGNFQKDVCAMCSFAIKNYKQLKTIYPEIQDRDFVGSKWEKVIQCNKDAYVEPDTSWINYINS